MKKVYTMIYIPLCFYLYRMSEYATVPLESEFTFHYVSTYTKMKDVFGRTLFVFTFHYVSTYTLLHIVQIITYHIIYIPLCFYLYDHEILI